MALRVILVSLLVMAIVALGALSLGGAARLGKRANVPLGTTLFEPSASDTPQARYGTSVLVAQRPASASEGYQALQDSAQSVCTDGRSISSLDLAPDLPEAADDWQKRTYPPGTRFTQSIECEGPLPNEMAIAAGTTEEKAEALVRARLGPVANPADGELRVAVVPYHEKDPKYHAVDRALGRFVRSFGSTRCPDGQTVVRRIVVATYPPAAPGKHPIVNSSRLVLGSSLACVSATAPAG